MQFQMAGSILESKDPLSFFLTDSIVRNEYLNFAVIINTDCSLRNSYANYGDIVIRNTTIQGDSIFEQKRPLI